MLLTTLFAKISQHVEAIPILRSTNAFAYNVIKPQKTRSKKVRYCVFSQS